MAYDNEDVELYFDDFDTKLDKGIESLSREYATIKAGRANPRILDKVRVDYYGTPTPLNQVGNIAAPEARMLVISVWDASMLKNVEKAILAANIGITPVNDGKVIRLIFPELTEERRREYVKQTKAMKKDSAITEDELATYEKDVDKRLSDAVAKVDKLSKDKEADILSV